MADVPEEAAQWAQRIHRGVIFAGKVNGLRRRPRWQRVLMAPVFLLRHMRIGARRYPLRWRMELAARLYWLLLREE